jgi:hypothetical protein
MQELINRCSIEAINYKSRGRLSALALLAKRVTPPDLRTVRALLEKGADPNIYDNVRGN